MDVREKLIALIASGVACPDDRDPFGEYCDSCRYEKSADCSTERLADHLIAHGVTVLPCNVGDKIYYIDRYTGKIDDDTVKFLTITKNGIKPILTRHNIKFWDFYELGKTAFFTKDEAEATLPQPPKGE